MLPGFILEPARDAAETGLAVTLEVIGTGWAILSTLVLAQTEPRVRCQAITHPIARHTGIPRNAHGNRPFALGCSTCQKNLTRSA